MKWKSISALVAAAGLCCGAVAIAQEAPADTAETPAATSAPREDDIRLGYAYFVERMVGSWNTNGFISRVRRNLRRDLPIMASVGAPAVKLCLCPPFAGLRYQEGQGAEVDVETLEASTRNMVTIIRQFADHGIPVVIDFVLNDYYLRGPNGWIPNNDPDWYQYAYEPMGFPEGAQRMARDFAEWESAFVEAFREADVERHILYYNLFTEANYSFRPYAKDVTSCVVRTVLASVNVPDDKRVADAYPHTDAQHLADDVAAVGKPLALTEVHAYPDVADVDLPAEFAHVKALFPGIRVELGEIGGSYCATGEDEFAEARTLRDALDAAHDAGARLAFNWGLWDADEELVCGEGFDGLRVGTGFSPGRPRATWGDIVDRYSALPGGDFETDCSGWTAATEWDAEVPITHCGPDVGGAATGRHFIRMETVQQEAHEVNSPSFAIDGTHLAVSAYLRGDCDAAFVHVDYRDESGWNWQTNRAPLIKKAVLPETNRFHQIQDLWGGEVFRLPDGTREARLRFVIYARTADDHHQLDIDAVAVNAFTPLE